MLYMLNIPFAKPNGNFTLKITGLDIRMDKPCRLGKSKTNLEILLNLLRHTQKP